MPELKIKELYIHPVKSLRGFSVDSIELDAFGAKYDRRWMVVDDQAMFISQREKPVMATIETSLEDGLLRLKDAGGSIVVEAADGRDYQVQVWHDRVTAKDCGDAVAQWLTQRLGQSCRLVYMPDEACRIVDKNYTINAEKVSFADGFPLLVIGQASLDDLNARMDAPVTMARFRPNIVVANSAPFAEDQWSTLMHKNVNFHVVKPCSRCVIPSLDPQTGERHKTINRVLAGFRRRDNVIYFGQNMLFDGQATIRVGDVLCAK